MVADTDLAKSPAAEPKDQSPPAKKTEPSPAKSPKPLPARKAAPSPKGKLKPWLMLIVIAASLAFAYNRWAPENFWRPGKNSSGPGFLSTGKIDVTGIMHYDKNPAALVSGRVVYEGDIVEGFKVLKIHKDKVEFEKDGQQFTKKITK
jgi:hypothetical protein